MAPFPSSLGVADLRTWVVLGRVSNLPTVWSNCLAGWLLGGGGEVRVLLGLCLGASLLYLGGTYLNDAFDVHFDRQHRHERPIPSGKIQLETVWVLGFLWLGLGLIGLFAFQRVTATLAVLLALNILVYDSIHKIYAFSPVLMAGCRFLLILLAASAGDRGVTGLSIWSALALGCYVMGLSYLALKESIRTRVQYWPCLFLAAPIVLGLVANQGEYLLRGAFLCMVLVIWVLNCLRHTFWSAQRNIGRSVAGLLAGIVLVDWLSVGGGTGGQALAFLALFGLALVLQRFVPAS